MSDTILTPTQAHAQSILCISKVATARLAIQHIHENGTNEDQQNLCHIQYLLEDVQGQLDAILEFLQISFE